MKKYLTISEVEEILGVTKNILRYIEKTNKSIKIHKIRGRRYYKNTDLDKLKNIISTTKSVSISNLNTTDSSYSIEDFIAEETVSTLPVVASNNDIVKTEDNLPKITDKNELEQVVPKQLQIFSKDENLPIKAENDNIAKLKDIKKDLLESKDKLNKLLTDTF